MIRIAADSILRSRLNGLNEQIDIQDEQGQSLGQFVPQSLYEELFYGALAKESGLPAEELKRMHQETGGRTLQELWQELGVQCPPHNSCWPIIGT